MKHMYSYTMLLIGLLLSLLGAASSRSATSCDHFADVSKMIIAAATASSAPATPAIVMPIEIMGLDGTSKTVSLPAIVRPALTLTLRLHGIEFDQEGSVRAVAGKVDTGYIPLDNDHVKVTGPGQAAKYGGLTGAFSTVNVALALPKMAGVIKLYFRFNGTDNVNSGFRVLKIGLQDANGADLLPASLFTDYDPDAEKPVYTSHAYINEGSYLWHSATLHRSSMASGTMGVACSSCHTDSGSDLKYFGYSNYAIAQRCRFHGLSQVQADQIASYIRLLPIKAYGRPWNPPYQPGPGTDAKPVAQWAAGAGLGAVLDRDEDMAPFWPRDTNGKLTVSAGDTLNMRELPIALQLLDWNHWLPRIHPKDAWGDDFTNSNLNKMYSGEGTGSWQWGTIPQKLAAGGDFIQNTQNGLVPWFAQWENFREEFTGPRSEAADLPWTPAYAEAVYSTSLWKLVKTWEVIQENDLEDKAPQIYGEGAGEPRSWLGGEAFQVSPARTKIPETPGLLTIDALQYEYLANAWYYTQVVLNSGNRHRQGWSPVDYGYAVGRVKDLADQSHAPEFYRLMALQVKALQQADTNGTVDTTEGWFPTWADNLFYSSWTDPTYGFGNALNDDITPATRGEMLTALTQAYLAKLQQYSPSDYFASGQTSPTESATDYTTLRGSIQMALPQLSAQGVDAQTLASLQAWSETMWPSLPLTPTAPTQN